MAHFSPVLDGSSVLLYRLCNYAQMYLTNMVRIVDHELGEIAVEGLKRLVDSKYSEPL